MREMGRPREAAVYFAAVAECNPNGINALTMLAEAELDAGNLVAARRAIEKAASLDASSEQVSAVIARLRQVDSPLAR